MRRSNAQRMTVRQGLLGFTLIELLVVIAILALLATMAAPFTMDWVYGSQTREARGKLNQAYATAKALALRNPLKAEGTGSAALLRAVMANDVITLLVCPGDPVLTGTGATCVSGHASVAWQASLPAKVGLTLGGTTVSTSASATLKLNNRGMPDSGSSFTLSRGGSNNDETGTLY